MLTFEEIRDAVDIVNAAEVFGMQIRQNKSMCIFHSDTTPSLSFKYNRFRCFSCGARGDVFDLLGKLLNLSPRDVAEELSRVYHLCSSTGSEIDYDKIRIERAKREKIKTFKDWLTWATKVYNNYCWKLKDWKKQYAPENAEVYLHPKFVEACHMLDTANYRFVAVFVEGDKKVQDEFYSSHYHYMNQLSKRLEGEELLANGDKTNIDKAPNMPILQSPTLPASEKAA